MQHNFQASPTSTRMEQPHSPPYQERHAADQGSSRVALTLSMFRPIRYNGETYYTNPPGDASAAEHLLRIEQVVQLIIKSTKDLFVVRETEVGTALVENVRAAGVMLYHTLGVSDAPLSTHFPAHHFSPHAELYFKHKQALVDLIDTCQEKAAFLELQYPDLPRDTTNPFPPRRRTADHIDTLLVGHSFPGLFGDLAAPLCRLLNGFVSAVRKEAASKAFKKRLAGYHRTAIENYKSLKTYTDDIFRAHSRILVVRIDLAYDKTGSPCTPNGDPVTAERAKADREHLLKNMRSNNLFKAMVGYVWKLEYGLEKGFHYHWLFFFDGSKVREDITIGRLIGEYWVKIVGPHGLYWNCNQNKQRYQRLGIGMIHYKDKEPRKCLETIMAYLTKTDHHLKLNSKLYGRSFGKGESPKEPIVKRGRPRLDASIAHPRERLKAALEGASAVRKKPRRDVEGRSTAS